MLSVSVFYNFTGVHNGYIVTYFCYDSQIVGDHDHGGLVFGLKFSHQLQHLRLDRNIQSSGGFICNKKSGVTCQSHGNDYTLFHTSGELMRIIASPVRFNSYKFQHFAGLGISILLTYFFIVEPDYLHNLFSNCDHRI